MILSRWLGLLLGSAICFGCYGEEGAADSTDYDAANVGFYLALNANISSPGRMSKSNYGSGAGMGGQLGLKMDSLNGWLGGTLFLSYDDAPLKLENSGSIAQVYQVYLGLAANILIIRMGIGWGLLKFSLPAKVFDSLGGTTLTELNQNNNRWEFSEYLSLGVHVPLPVKNDIANRFSLDYDYRFISADRAMMVWHGMLSSLVVDACIAVASGLAQKFLGKDSDPADIVSAIMVVGGTFAYWYYNYDYHNWPFHDAAPFRYGINTVLLSYKINRFK
ncbi:MAG TPA: hypothetical protein VMC41_01025 [Candidatus Nanoarchaeia archaeon]|nr:hypothetical protein [Candidatus Nanoarchaeia archaeon]